MEKFPKFSHFFYQSTKCGYLTDTTHFTMMQAHLVLMPVSNTPAVFYCIYRKKMLSNFLEIRKDRCSYNFPIKVVNLKFICQT